MRLLFCASDPGGAKNLVPVAGLARATHDVSILASPSTNDIFAEQGFAPTCITKIDHADAAEFIEQFDPNAVLLGTASPGRPETHLTLAARDKGVRTVVVLDEWYRYRIRFGPHDGPLTHVPDFICCQDQLAHDEAIAEGLPAAPLVITGNPSLAKLSADIQNLSHAPVPDKIATKDERPIVLFISERMAEAYGTAPGETGFVGPYIGYTEHVVRDHIARALDQLGQPCRVVEKLHPNDTSRPQPPKQHPGNDWLALTNELSLSDILPHCRAVIGMKSVALVEAALFGFRPLSYQPGLIGPDICTAARLGLAEPVADFDTLTGALGVAMTSQNNVLDARQSTLSFARPDAAANVLALAVSE